MQTKQINLEQTSTDYMEIYKTIYAQDYAFEDSHQYNAEELALEVV